MRIAFVGDVMLGRIVNKMLKQNGPEFPWGNTLSVLHHADLRICNLECVLSDVGNPWSSTSKMFHFRTDEKNIKTLQIARINIVSLANNHVLDYEYEALQRMLDILDGSGILHGGAGKDLSEASKPAFFSVEGKKIALIAFTDNEPGWAAQINHPGVLYIPTEVGDLRVQNFLIYIEKLKREADFLIVSAHWGSNWGYYPSKEQVSMGHALIDAGADLVFGHSPHVFRGIEIYKAAPIIYSAGDFIDDYAVDEVEKNDESFIFILEQEQDSRLKIYLYPTCIDQFQAQLAPSHREKAILSKMDALCKDFGSKLKCFSNCAFLEI